MDIPVTVVAGEAPGFELRMETPRGEVTFASSLGEPLFEPGILPED